MSQQINCPECGDLNKIGEDFCHNCGTQLKLNEPTEPQPQTITQNQFPTIKIKPTKPKKISRKMKILIYIAFLFGSSIVVGLFILIAHFLFP